MEAGNFLLSNLRTYSLVWSIRRIVGVGTRGVYMGVKVRCVVRVLDIKPGQGRGQGGLSRPRGQTYKYIRENNLLRYSKGKETSCCVNRKGTKVREVEPEDSLYRDPAPDYRTRET